VSLWATWCIPCINELENIHEQYAERQKQTPFKIVAISIDDSRTSARVKSFVKGKGWTFDIYLDENSDLKRALNINDVPHVLIIKKGKIVYQHNGYVPGNEEELFEKLKSI
jgi:peroxiredoxin